MHADCTNGPFEQGSHQEPASKVAVAWAFVLERVTVFRFMR
jgi:hypothetical protein